MLKPSLSIAAALAAVCLLISCETLREGPATGSIRLNFVHDMALCGTKSLNSIPDTNSFIVTLTDSKGNTVYKGLYGSAPESFDVSPGVYTVEAVSLEFTEPLFDCPQFGDSRTVSVPEGKEVSVTLNCVQMNSGLKLNVDSNFRSAFPDGTIYVKSSQGRLMYGYSEKRTGFFLPGNVSVAIGSGGSEQVLLSRILAAQQMLTLNLSASSDAAQTGGIRISVDTTRNWLSESFVLGEEPGKDPSCALSVSQARSMPGAENVWIYGFIVGGDLSSSKCSFDPPFISRTNLVLSGKSNCRDKSLCMSVQLSQGDIRDALNLVDNPENLGRQVFVKGNVVASYFGVPGIQSIKEYQWK